MAEPSYLPANYLFNYDTQIQSNIYTALEELCDQFSSIIIPKQTNPIPKQPDESDIDLHPTLTLIQGLNDTVTNLSNNLDETIVRIGELHSSGMNNLHPAILKAGNIIPELEFRINDLNDCFQQIDIADEMINTMNNCLKELETRYKKIRIKFQKEDNEMLNRNNDISKLFKQFGSLFTTSSNTPKSENKTFEMAKEVGVVSNNEIQANASKKRIPKIEEKKKNEDDSKGGVISDFKKTIKKVKDQFQNRDSEDVFDWKRVEIPDVDQLLVVKKEKSPVMSLKNTEFDAKVESKVSEVNQVHGNDEEVLP